MTSARRLYELTRLPTFEEIRDQEAYVLQLAREVLELDQDQDEQTRVAYRLSTEEKRLTRMVRTIR